MTDDSATPAPTGPAGDRSWRIPLLVGALVVVIVLVVALATRGGDPEPAASDPATSSSTSTSTSPSDSASASPSPSPTDPPDTASVTPSAEGDPVISPVINKAVKDAIKDDFPALVPSGVPAGWTVLSADYSAKSGGRWTIDLIDPNRAPVQLVQASQDVEELVAENLGMEMQPSGTVNLGDYGSGKWTVYTGGGSTAVVTTIADTTALVVGPDQETVVTLAEQLLTAEDADLPEAG
jgi:cytoskeletal protein RodZ